MRFLKGLAFFLLTFLLSLSLFVFGLVFMLKSTALNPDFITSELDKLDVSTFAEEMISEQIPGQNSPEAFSTSLVNAISKLEPLIKEQVNTAIYSIFDYLKGERENPELARTLSDTILSSDSIVSVVDELDISSITGQFINEQLAEQVPEGMDEYISGVIEDTLVDVEPWIKEQIGTAADPIADYLLGESQSLNVVISTEPVINSLKDNMKQALLESPPPELAGLPPAMIEIALDALLQELSETIPATFMIDASLIGTELPAQIASGIAQAEDYLEQGEEIYGYINTTFYTLIGLMILLMAGIVFLKREVRSPTRKIGIAFLTSGTIWYALTYVAKYFGGKWITTADIPSALQAWLPEFIHNLLSPLVSLALGLLIGGIVLIVVSFVYKPEQIQPEA